MRSLSLITAPLLILLVKILQPHLAESSQSCQCPKNKVNAGSFCYEIVSKGNAVGSGDVAWHKARDYCKKRNSTLPILKNEVENKAFATLNLRNVPIGLEWVTAAWKWVTDGSSLDKKEHVNWDVDGEQDPNADTSLTKVYFNNAKWRNVPPQNDYDVACQTKCEMKEDIRGTYGRNDDGKDNEGQTEKPLLYVILVVGCVVGVAIGVYIGVLHDNYLQMAKQRKGSSKTIEVGEREHDSEAASGSGKRSIKFDDTVDFTQ